MTFENVVMLNIASTVPPCPLQQDHCTLHWALPHLAPPPLARARARSFGRQQTSDTAIGLFEIPSDPLRYQPLLIDLRRKCGIRPMRRKIAGLSADRAFFRSSHDAVSTPLAHASVPARHEGVCLARLHAHAAFINAPALLICCLCQTGCCLNAIASCRASCSRLASSGSSLSTTFLLLLLLALALLPRLCLLLLLAQELRRHTLGLHSPFPLSRACVPPEYLHHIPMPFLSCEHHRRGALLVMSRRSCVDTSARCAR